MHPEETKVHRRGLILVPGLAANHEAQPPLYLTVQEMCISLTVGQPQARFIRMKSASKKRTPSIVNLTVKRRYLTEREVERLTTARASTAAMGIATRP